MIINADENFIVCCCNCSIIFGYTLKEQFNTEGWYYLDYLDERGERRSRLLKFPIVRVDTFRGRGGRDILSFFTYVTT